jgi:cbb3-type cytochrome oxidase subunit 3
MFRKFYISLIISFFLFLPVMPAGAQSYDFMRDSGLAETAEGTGHTEVADVSVAEMAGIVIQAILALLGVIFLILTIYGGIIWMTAAGNDQRIDKAKKIIINSVIGLVIIVSAYAITAFIGSRFGL